MPDIDIQKVHLLVRSESGPIKGAPFVMFAGQFQAPGSGSNLLVACQPNRTSTFGIHCTDEACLVSCDACKTTKHYEEADKMHPVLSTQNIPPQVMQILTGS